VNSAYSFDHLIRMSDDNGLFEHAEYDLPRKEHGYCVDDVARGLVVIGREVDASPELLSLAAVYLDFITTAQAVEGRFHNRMDVFGQLTDTPTLDDCWGRALWALGSVAARVPSLSVRALHAFDRSVGWRSPSLRAMSFAALGAAEVLALDPGHHGAQRLLGATALSLASFSGSSEWPWPEPRLRYANGVIPQVLLLAGHLLDEPRWRDEGMRSLLWLVEVETRDGHLSVTPVGGWGPGEERPGFDQQPIEVAALADACRTAFEITGEPRWLETIGLCADWFDGRNDTGLPMTDVRRSVGFDGLQAAGRNQNHGAESTLAMLTTFQHLQWSRVDA
jgi:hypothetical protein